MDQNKIMTGQDTDKTQLPIIIAGGGVGGLCTAIALAKQGFAVRVLEQAPQFGAIGYGIQLGPNVFAMFDVLGIRAEIMAKSIVPNSVWMFDAYDGKPVVEVRTGAEFEARYANPYIVIHRVDLHNVLTAAAQREPRVLLDENALVTGYEDLGDSVRVSLADGRSFEGSLLIGADGLRSKVRQQMLADAEPELIGYVAHRTIVPIDKAPKGIPLDDVILWGGAGFHIVNYPLRDKSIFNIVAVFRTDTFSQKGDVESYRAELQATYADAHPAMREMISMMDLERRWPIADRAPRRGWSKGRVVLTGDAAHATLQSLAQGACMAIEDAVVLAQCLALAQTQSGLDHAAAFRKFESERLLRTARVQLESRYLWDIFYHTGGIEAQVRNEGRRAQSLDDVYRCLDWLYHPIKIPAAL